MIILIVFLFQEVCQRLVNLSAQLHALQVRLQDIHNDIHNTFVRFIFSLCLFQLWLQLLSLLLSLTQAAVIRQDSVLELCLTSGPAPSTAIPAPLNSAPRLCRSMSRDTGLDAGPGAAMLGELALLQKQHSLLQEEVGRLRPLEAKMKDSERARAQLEQQLKEAQQSRRGRRGRRGKGGNNGDKVDIVVVPEQVS